mgnify:CR=1 FL=1
MAQILNVHKVNDYATYIGAPVLHPLVSVIHYDELEHCRNSLNRYDVYGMFLGDEVTEGLTYGMLNYDLAHHALMCVAPGQIGGKADDGNEIQAKGWALLFDPELLHGTDLGRRISRYSYFSYNTSEALLMSEKERGIIVVLMERIRQELLEGNDDEHTSNIVVALLQLVLEYIGRFYARQMSTSSSTTADLLLRFENMLKRYYDNGIYQEQGLPTVKYCARELFLSPNYFSDLMRQLTGESARQAIRRYVMQRARELLITGCSVQETAENLGFEYPQHFTRMFKSYFGVPPTALRGKKT